MLTMYFAPRRNSSAWSRDQIRALLTAQLIFHVFAPHEEVAGAAHVGMVGISGHRLAGRFLVPIGRQGPIRRRVSRAGQIGVSRRVAGRGLVRGLGVVTWNGNRN